MLPKPVHVKSRHNNHQQEQVEFNAQAYAEAEMAQEMKVAM
jgi:hypothetical protein